MSSYKSFYLVNQFSLLEEIFEPISEVYSRIDLLKFKDNFKTSNVYYLRLSAFGLGEFKANDIVMPKNILVFNSDQVIFNLISSGLRLDAILKIELRF